MSKGMAGVVGWQWFGLRDGTDGMDGWKEKLEEENCHHENQPSRDFVHRDKQRDLITHQASLLICT